jgi:iron complex transport system substrate-binding protein
MTASTPALPASAPSPPTVSASTTVVDLAFQEIVDELTRRGFLAGTIGAAALLGTAGCHDDTAPVSHPAAQSRTIQTAYGPVTVPAAPQRVVCVDVYTVSALLDVGYTPIGVGGGGASLMLAKYGDRYRAIDKVASADQQVDVEAIAALAPDLILGVDYPYISSLRKQLGALAPTAIFTWNTSGDWEAMAAGAAAAVGKTSAEHDLEDRYRDRAAEIRQTYAEVLASNRFALVTAGGGQAYVWLPRSGVGMVLADAGVQFDAASSGPGVSATKQDQAVGFKALSFERLGALDDATAIITLAGSDGEPDADSAAMLKQPVFASLPAAQAGNVIALANYFPFSYGQALGALDELAAFLDRLTENS